MIIFKTGFFIHILFPLLFKFIKLWTLLVHTTVFTRINSLRLTKIIDKKGVLFHESEDKRQVSTTYPYLYMYVRFQVVPLFAIDDQSAANSALVFATVFPFQTEKEIFYIKTKQNRRHTHAIKLYKI